MCPDAACLWACEGELLYLQRAEALALQPLKLRRHAACSNSGQPRVRCVSTPQAWQQCHTARTKNPLFLACIACICERPAVSATPRGVWRGQMGWLSCAGPAGWLACPCPYLTPHLVR